MIRRSYATCALRPVLLGLAVASACGQVTAASELTELMDCTGLAYRWQTDGSAALAVQGEQVHTLVIRPLETHTVAYCLLARPAAPGGAQEGPTLLQVDKTAAPEALWRTLAEMNANPWLPRISYVEGHIVVSVLLPHSILTPELLKDGIMAVGMVSDLALPRVLEALATE